MKLPTAMYGAHAAVINSTLYISGGWCCGIMLGAVETDQDIVTLSLMRMSYSLIKTQHTLHNHYCARVCVISHYVTSPRLRSESARGPYIST